MLQPQHAARAGLLADGVQNRVVDFRQFFRTKILRPATPASDQDDETIRAYTVHCRSLKRGPSRRANCFPMRTALAFLSTENYYPCRGFWAIHPDMKMDLKGKWVLITGASSGFGAAAAVAFGAEGAQLLLGARRVDRLEQVAREAKSAGATEAHVHGLDVSETGSV